MSKWVIVIIEVLVFTACIAARPLARLGGPERAAAKTAAAGGPIERKEQAIATATAPFFSKHGKALSDKEGATTDHEPPAPKAPAGGAAPRSGDQGGKDKAGPDSTSQGAAATAAVAPKGGAAPPGAKDAAKEGPEQKGDPAPAQEGGGGAAAEPEEDEGAEGEGAEDEGTGEVEFIQAENDLGAIGFESLTGDEDE